VHFELTAYDVTECVGGGIDLTSDDLARNYQTCYDPQLNYA
jgi:3-deoxy-7-phosphoheptulonate synthase